MKLNVCDAGFKLQFSELIVLKIEVSRCFVNIPAFVESTPTT